MLEADPDTARDALRLLLDGQRLRVHADAERGFRVEGWLRLPLLEKPTAQGAWQQHLGGTVAGSGGALRNARRLPVPAFELAA